MSVAEINELFDTQFHLLNGLKQNINSILTKLREEPLTNEMLQNKVELAKNDAKEFLSVNQKRIDGVLQLISEFLKHFEEFSDVQIFKNEKRMYESSQSLLKRIFAVRKSVFKAFFG